MSDDAKEPAVDGIAELAREVRASRVGLLTVLLLGAVQAGEDLGDVLGNALGDTADLLGSVDGVVARRPGSWEATHVYALAAGYAQCAPCGTW